MTQYTDYSSVPQMVRDIVANRCQLLDEYILFQTGNYEYTALIHDLITGKVTKLTFSRTNNYNTYTVAESTGTWDYSYSNEYYIYSNVGVGAALELPVMDGVVAHSAVVLTVLLMFLVVFRGALFPFRKKK